MGMCVWLSIRLSTPRADDLNDLFPLDDLDLSGKMGL